MTNPVQSSDIGSKYLRRIFGPKRGKIIKQWIKLRSRNIHKKHDLLCTKIYEMCCMTSPSSNSSLRYSSLWPAEIVSYALLLLLRLQLKFRPIPFRVLKLILPTSLPQRFITYHLHVCSILSSTFLSTFYDVTSEQTNLLWQLYLGNGRAPYTVGLTALCAETQTVLQLALLTIILL